MKNKKKEFSQLIGQLNDIRHQNKERLLRKYLNRCKFIHALAFFQWRCAFVEDPEGVEKNKSIFYQRIDTLVKHLDSTLKKRKTIIEDAKDGGFKEEKKEDPVVKAPS